MLVNLARHPIARLTLALYILITVLGIWTSVGWRLPVSQGILALGCVIALLCGWSQKLRTYFGRPSSWIGLGSTGLYCLMSLVLVQLQPGAREALTEMLSAATDWRQLFFTWVGAPIVEEVYFRGILLAAIKQGFDSRPGHQFFWLVYLQALVFFVFHIPLDPTVWAEAWALGGVPVNFGPFLLGVWCGVIALRDNSLWMAMLAHACANFFVAPWSVFIVGIQ